MSVAVFGYLLVFGVAAWQGTNRIQKPVTPNKDVCSEQTTVCVVSSIPKEDKLKDSKNYKEESVASRKGIKKTYTYNVVSKGNINASLADFKVKANQTLNSALGWGEIASFQEVAGAGNFTLVLSEAKYLPSYSTGCSASWSCRADRYVIINQDRWLGATSAWNSAGGGLRDYQHMVVNHEVGHWLGFGHSSCGGSGQRAPVMQQQSINLQGCKFNPWPHASEVSQLK